MIPCILTSRDCRRWKEDLRMFFFKQQPRFAAKRQERAAYLKKVSFLCLFAFLTTAMLLESDKALILSLTGLNLWFQKMIPTLLPFMILSGILIRMNLSDSFAHLFSPVLKPLFRLSDSCLYCLVIGFLCGFPMGARVTAESYQRGKLSRREAELMLAFCNNIGPVYFTGFVLHLFPVERPLIFLAGMYLLPFLYGLVLRYTLYRDIPMRAFLPSSAPSGRAKPLGEKNGLHAASISPASPAVARAPSLLEETQNSIVSALYSIASLGGYMILFNLLNLIPDILLPSRLTKLETLLGCVLEITSGLSRLPRSMAFWGYVLLPFGGLSCIAQTYSMIRETDLSLGNYVAHKVVQTVAAFGFYLWVFAG